MSNNLTWHDVIGKEKKQLYFMKTLDFIKNERQKGKTIYPLQKDIFNAFRFTALSDVKVVILGQDPYHGPKQADGLSFSVHPDTQVPPSLANIYKELKNDIPGFTCPNHGSLQSWAKQGVLLLNTVLTVEGHHANSHAHLGWKIFTDTVITTLNKHCNHLVFLLWGAYAKKKGNLINRKCHHVLETSHPSPFSAYRGFFGCRHFSKTNQFLKQHGVQPINWLLHQYTSEARNFF
ncbi:uracil-DNA glycosylase [Candidatus Gillettellia adelgis]